MGRVSFAQDVEERRIEEIEDADDEQYSVFPYQDTPENKSWAGALPMKQGLYDPALEKDACGVGFAAHIKGKASHKIVTDGESADGANLAGGEWLIVGSTKPSLQHDPSRCGRV